MNTECRCGHDREVHEHFRAGNDCGVCGKLVCPGYRRQRRGFVSWIQDVISTLPSGKHRSTVRKDGDVRGTGSLD